MSSQVESLRGLCLRAVVKNYSELTKQKKHIPTKFIAEITQGLSDDIPLPIAAANIQNEEYWKKRCSNKFKKYLCRPENHDNSWKQLYFELSLKEKVELFDPEADHIHELLELLESCNDCIHTLTFDQNLAHLDLYDILSTLPHVKTVDIIYGIRNLGMKYDRLYLGLKMADAISLAKVLTESITICTLKLSENMIDDDILRVLATGLQQNKSITHLDLSHNCISDNGARLIANILTENKNIKSLNLADNAMSAEGARYIAESLSANLTPDLTDLNLKLNRLGDEGCEAILCALLSYTRLRTLDLSSNKAGPKSSLALANFLQKSPDRQTNVDVSGNELNEQQIEHILAAIKNRTLFALDLRGNPGYKDLQIKSDRYDTPGCVRAQIEERIQQNQFTINIETT